MIEFIKQKYNIIRKIGQGGMAEIFLVTKKNNNKKLAIKILDPNSKNDIIRKKRFYQEIEIMKKVDSPYVAKIYDAKISKSCAYIVMEYVDGYILKDYINKYSRLTVDETIEFIKQLSLGLYEIHNNNIIHRDIKSQNVMVGQSGRIKIIDFGIAIDNKSERLTQTNMLIGSAQYLSPELIDKKIPTRHADIYALGVLMYEMLTGEVPFKGKDFLETLKKHKIVPIPKISKNFPNVPQSVENIITKATAKKIYKRYDTMYEMYLDLKTCLTNSRAYEKPINLNNKKDINFTIIINSKITLWVIIVLLFIIIVTIIILIIWKGF